ncbi:MAG: histidinol-phosphatase [Clostridia bacterium]|nr:histidinol-phosphatase [Clostridia bacterium]
MQSFNFHTHTLRCRHAKGSEREFIETAIAAGMDTLGFSDHAPQIFPGDYYSDYRMFPEETEGYVNTLCALREEYRDRINILIGYEAEYYPDLFEDLLKHIRQYPCDYLILGQHFLDNETTRRYSGRKTEDPQYLTDYVDQVCAGIRTGVFTYAAHPDLQDFTGDRAVYRREYSRLIRCAMENDVPLEINMLGIAGGRHYPCEDFWALAGEMGASAVIGCDAHEPYALTMEDAYGRAMEIAQKYSLRLVRPTLRSPF